MEQNKIKIGDIVKVIMSIDKAVPIDERLMGKVGKVIAINNDRPSPISVEFRKVDSFWPEELEIQI